MTCLQIAKALNLHVNNIYDAFKAAVKEHPELENPNKAKNSPIGTDYTLEQVLLAMSYLRDGNGISEIEKIMLTEDFTMRPPPKAKAKGIKGTEDFIEKIKTNPKKKCCATCSYCTKSTIRNRKPVLRPYCNLWERFIIRLKADPYNDHCRLWEYSGQEPLIFYTHDSPTNVDIYGNVKNEILGFDVSKFGKESKGEVSLITDIGVDTDVIEQFN